MIKRAYLLWSSIIILDTDTIEILIRSRFFVVCFPLILKKPRHKLPSQPTALYQNNSFCLNSMSFLGVKLIWKLKDTAGLISNDNQLLIVWLDAYRAVLMRDIDSWNLSFVCCKKCCSTYSTQRDDFSIVNKVWHYLMMVVLILSELSITNRLRLASMLLTFIAWMACIRCPVIKTIWSS